VTREGELRLPRRREDAEQTLFKGKDIPLKEMNELNWNRFNDRLDAGLANLRAEMIKWMFVFWIGNVVSLGGLIVGMRFLK
jgi:hypothetical protein